jgi:transposase
MSELGRDPSCGEAFVFVGTRGDRLKILLWQQHGYWLCQHRLERGRFRLPEVRRQDGRACAVSLSAWEWQSLLDGVVVKQMQRLARYRV